MNRYRHWLKDERDTYVRLWQERPKWVAELPLLLFLIGLLMASWWVGTIDSSPSITISVETAPSYGDAGSGIRWKY
jgi:hypothetical protein